MKTVRIKPNQVRALVEVKSKMEAAQAAYLSALKVVFGDDLDMEKDLVVSISIDGVAKIKPRDALALSDVGARVLADTNPAQFN